jgi:nucleotide-binding universal stress UspA family protein
VYELKRILVPTDFSRHARKAFAHALAFGPRYHPEITLLHVDEFGLLPLASEESAPVPAAYRAAATEYFAERFSELAEQAAGYSVTLLTMVKSGRAYKCIIEEAERGEYDLVIQAARGQTHLSSYIIGSNAERVVRLSRQPVLTVRSGPSSEAQVKTVLCPTDLSPAGNVALPYALSIARHNGAALYLHYISELEHPEAREDLLRRIPDLREFHPLASEVNVEYVFDRDLEPSNSIIRFAEDREIEITVMSTHGRKGLRRVHIGNNTAEVVRQSSRPVLTVTHPLHRKVFSSPATEPRSRNGEPISGGGSRGES